MIIQFPGMLMPFEVLLDLPKGTQAEYAHIAAGHKIVITAPITLKPNDQLFVDIRNSKISEIRRGGIVIWRAACVN